jgi:hypothetical protein
MIVEEKELDIEARISLWERGYWVIPDNVDTEGFDFSWRPSYYDRPYTHQFGTQWQKTNGPKFVIPESEGVKYHDFQNVRHKSHKENFAVINDRIDFDYSWHPDETEEPYIYVFLGTIDDEEKIVAEYHVEGATSRKYIAVDLKYKIPPIHEFSTAKELETLVNLYFDELFWAVPKNVDLNNFDFSWLPNKYEPPYIHRFGTQWDSDGGPCLVVPNNQGTKNQQVQKALRICVVPIYEIEDTVQDLIDKHPTETFWAVPKNIDKDSFDFSWLPNKYDPPYIHQFGTRYNTDDGPAYVVPANKGHKYHRDQVAAKLPINKYKLSKGVTIDKLMAEHANEIFWIVPESIDEDDFDFMWEPPKGEPPYLHQFGTQWTEDGGPLYVVPNSLGTKYQTALIAQKTSNDVIRFIETDLDDLINKYPEDNFWAVPKDIDVSNFDFSWQPRKDEPFLHVFGTQWQNTGGPIYVVADYEGIKYQTFQAATRIEDKSKFTQLTDDEIIFDYSWHHDDRDPPYIYKFGLKNEYRDNFKYVLEYRVPNATQEKYVSNPIVKLVNKDIKKYYIETSLEDLVKEHPNETFWALNPELSYDKFDFTWEPMDYESPYVHVFGNKENLDLQTYFVIARHCKDSIEYNYVDELEIDVESKLDMFYIDRMNKGSNEKYEQLKQRFPQLQKTRFVNGWAEIISSCANRSKTRLFWVLSSEIDYADFDFNYYPSKWQLRMLHVFGTQWTDWGFTYLVNKDAYMIEYKHRKTLEGMTNLNFTNKKATISESLYDIVLIDFGNDNNCLEVLKEKAPNRNVTVIPYDTDYYQTFFSLIETLPKKLEHHVWICSSICDYSNFDFTMTYHTGTDEQLYVYHTNEQKYGDTFLANVNELRLMLPIIKTLDDYPEINFRPEQKVNRLPAPVKIVNEDTHVNSISTDFNFPYQVLITEDNKGIRHEDTETMALWKAEDKTIIVTSTGASRIIVPKEAAKYVKKELYDYPYIITSSKTSNSKPLDIVFFSNGEKCAEENYQHLLNIAKDLPNLVVGVFDVKGRVASQHEAANVANTPWYFLVNAKLKVNENFNFDWQPDRLQVPKHYIFTATNPLNGLEYGHQAIVANNKNITLNTKGTLLDFTLEGEHEVVDVNSGISTFNLDEWDTWRTAFREVTKLKYSVDTEQSEENKFRLEKWLTVADGEYGDWCLRGANDAVEYYESVSGDFEKLKLTYEWDWLRTRFDGLR